MTYMHMAGSHEHGIYISIGIWLHGYMELGSSGILTHMHRCNGLGRHGVQAKETPNPNVRANPRILTFETTNIPSLHGFKTHPCKETLQTLNSHDMQGNILLQINKRNESETRL